MSYPDKKAVIKLQFPIEIGGAKVEEVSMRRPTARDLILAENESQSVGSAMQQDVNMFSRLCEIEADHLMDLDALDLQAVGEQYKAFFEPTESSGKSTSSEA